MRVDKILKSAINMPFQKMGKIISETAIPGKDIKNNRIGRALKIRGVVFLKIKQ